MEAHFGSGLEPATYSVECHQIHSVHLGGCQYNHVFSKEVSFNGVENTDDSPEDQCPCLGRRDK